MALDYFLKLDGIKGESTDAKHKDEIELESFSWGAHQAGTASAGGGGGAGKVQFSDLAVTARVSAASPNLFSACASGKHIASGLLTVRRAAKSGLEFLKIKLTDILVTQYQQSATQDDDAPVDQVGFDFAKFELEYVPQTATGAAGGSVKAGWDLKQNKKA